MDGYQPKNRCNDCTKQNDCKKYKDGKEACKKYESCPPPLPPKSGSNVTPAFRKPAPMPEIKPAKAEMIVPLEVSRETYESLREKGLLNPNVLYTIKESSAKQRTVLSVRDFAILYNMVNEKIPECEIQAEELSRSYIGDKPDPVLGRLFYTDESKKKRLLEENHYYQDLLRIREKIGDLNIEVETPVVEVEE